MFPISKQVLKATVNFRNLKQLTVVLPYSRMYINFTKEKIKAYLN